jgi:hypothetical protein
MVQEVYIYISIFKNMNIYDLDIYTSELGILSSVCVYIWGYYPILNSFKHGFK